MAAASDRVSMNEVFPLLKEVTEWEELGLHLGLSMAAIMEIRSIPGGVGEKRIVMMSKWLHSDLEATWNKLAKALLKMNYKVLSTQIRKKFCSSDTEVVGSPAQAVQEEAEPSSEKRKYSYIM